MENFPVTSGMDDEAGYLAFTSLHVPLYTLLLRGFFGGKGVNRGLVLGLDAFFVAHALLHMLFIRRPKYRLRSVFSWVLILGARVCGALDLIFSL